MRAGFGLAVALWLSGASADLWAQGKLAEIREDVKGEHPAHPAENSHTHSAEKSHSDAGSGSDDDVGISFNLTGLGEYYRTDWRLFPAYPYREEVCGYMLLDPGPDGKIAGHTAEELDLRPWSFRLSLENGNNFDYLNRFTGTLQAETQCGLGLYTSWNYLYENLGYGYYDDLILGNITLTWRFLESRRILMRCGVGAWIVTTPCGCYSDAGVNLHLSMDYFPARPWVISGLIEGGSLGETGILHTRATVGLLWRGLEFYGGYDFMQIGRTDLHTPMVGVRVWF